MDYFKTHFVVKKKSRKIGKLERREEIAIERKKGRAIDKRKRKRERERERE
jgi:hypothetical protein